ncbi:GNAT family N-acetyltransferase [Pedobacter aquatilis]|uniref:GNAT family N-acetyltransferase n=1 Tax=Pedobacter aquatilis TaxID=351343 RepID=UPI00292D9982|nr:GNAT family N-acetyltransferase [Pedobacter aquatilis]
MKIEKLFSIRAYEDTREAKTALVTFLQTIRSASDLQTRLCWNQEKITSKLSSGICLFIMLGEEICGLVDYHVQPLPRSSISHPKNHKKDTVFISDFIIHPRYRRIGLGKMLFQVVENFSHYLGKKTIKIALALQEKSSLLFFERLGFEPSGVFASQDVHIYELRLKAPFIQKSIKRNAENPRLKQSHARSDIKIHDF